MIQGMISGGKASDRRFQAPKRSRTGDSRDRDQPIYTWSCTGNNNQHVLQSKNSVPNPLFDAPSPVPLNPGKTAASGPQHRFSPHVAGGGIVIFLNLVYSAKSNPQDKHGPPPGERCASICVADWRRVDENASRGCRLCRFKFQGGRENKRPFSG